MNSTHAAVGVGSISAMDALTTLLTGWHGLDADHATAAAWLVCAVAGAIYTGTVTFVRWRWPTLPVNTGNEARR